MIFRLPVRYETVKEMEANARRTNDVMVLIALWLMMFSASAQVIILAPILPEISSELAIPHALQGLLITSYTVTLGAMALVTGPISDKVGRRLVLLVGCGAMTVALVLHGIVKTYESLLTVRAMAGAAGGMLSGGAVAYVGDYFPYERRGWANGWVMSGIAFGQILGIPAGKLLAGAFGFRWPFLMFAATMLGATLLIFFFLPQPTVQRETARLTVGGSLRRYGELLLVAPVRAAAATYGLMFLSLGLFVIYLPTWLETEVGVDTRGIATLFFVGGIVNVVTSPMAGRLSDRLGRKPLIVSSCLGLAIVMVLTPYFVVNTWMAYLLFAAAMLTFALRMSPLQSLMTVLVPDQRRGMLMSLAIAVGQVGMGIGSAVAGVAYTKYGYASNTFLAAAAIGLMALLVHFGLPEPATSDVGTT